MLPIHTKHVHGKTSSILPAQKPEMSFFSILRGKRYNTSLLYVTDLVITFKYGNNHFPSVWKNAFFVFNNSKKDATDDFFGIFLRIIFFFFDVSHRLCL